jgi:hypothetical protein
MGSLKDASGVRVPRQLVQKAVRNNNYELGLTYDKKEILQ